MWKSNTLIFQKLHICMHKKYQEKWENAYLRVKNGYWLTLLARWQILGKNFRPPPDQILDPLLGIPHLVLMGTPSSGRMGYPLLPSQEGWGSPPLAGWRYPPP